MKNIIFWGATGHSKVLRECTKDEYNLVALFDNDKKVESPFIDIPIYHRKEEFERWIEEYNKKYKDDNELKFLVAIGGAKGKDRIDIQKYLELYCTPIIAKHKTAFIADSAKIGLGSQILAHSSICTDVIIGNGCIINTGAIVDHECIINNGVHICPGAHLAGIVKVEDYATIYTGSIILPRIKIGEGAIVGAGAVVRKDVEPNTVVIGNPARFLRYTDNK